MCPLGSILNGTNVIVCQNDGTWSGATPTCNALGVPLKLRICDQI